MSNDDLISKVKNYNEEELDSFLRYEDDEKNRENLKKEINKLKALEGSINLEAKCIFSKIKDKDKPSLKKILQYISDVEKLENTLKDNLEKLKKNENVPKKIKCLNRLMIGGSILIIALVSLLKLESSGWIASIASIIALVYTILFFIFSIQDLGKKILIKISRRIFEPVIFLIAGAIITFFLSIYKQRTDLINWLGCFATLAAFWLGLMFYFYERKVIKKWWEKNKKTIQKGVIFIVILYIVYAILIYFTTITGNISFKDTSIGSVKVKLIEKKSDKLIASTMTNGEGKFILQCPIYITKDDTKFLIIYDPDVSSQTSSFFELPQTLVSLLSSENIVDDNDDNKIKYDKLNIDIHNNIYIDNRTSIVGKWRCLLKNSSTEFIWEIDHSIYNIIEKVKIKQTKGENTAYYKDFNKKEFIYNYNNYTFSPKEQTDIKIYGSIEKDGGIKIDVSPQIKGMDKINIINCLRCLD